MGSKKNPFNDRICDQCGKSFHRRGKRKFRCKFVTCSKKCKNKYQSKIKHKSKPRTGTNIECKICNKNRYFSPSAVQKYCSYKCYRNDPYSNIPRKEKHYAYRGGVKYNRAYDLKLRKWQRFVRKRGGRKCAKCFRQDGIMHADHILPWADFPEFRYKTKNGQILCKNCHALKTKEENKHRGGKKLLNDMYKEKIFNQYKGGSNGN